MGRWIAYQSDESGRYEVYVRPFPPRTGRLQVSSGGGASPEWSPDGRRLYYISNGGMRAATLDVGGAHAGLIRTDSLFSADGIRVGYAVDADGAHFLIPTIVGAGAKIVVVTNWWRDALARMNER